MEDASHPLPKYRRIVELGRGGMAIVNLALMRSSHNVTKLVVVKELEHSLAMEQEFRTMFLEEARLAARLNHPHVVQMFEVVDHVDSTVATRPDGLEGACALVMEYLDGQPLNRLRGRMKNEPSALSFYLAILVDALSGLDYAHTLTDYDGKPLGIVHRDVSPHNVFVTYTGEVKVLDFGIAKANDSSMAPTRTGVVKGKIGYMAPEQARGDRVDARGDVFAVGVMLWEVIVGKRLWAGMNEAAIVYKLAAAQIPMPREVLPEVPEALDAICRRALAFDPAQRFQSASEMRDALEAYAMTLPNRPTRRAIGELMVRLFAEERAQVRQIVEDQLGRVGTASTDSFVGASAPVLVKIPAATESSSSLHGKGGSGRTQAGASLSVRPSSRSHVNVLMLAVAGLTLVASASALFIVLRSRDAPTSPTQPIATVRAVVSTELPPTAKPVEPPPSASSFDTATHAEGAPSQKPATGHGIKPSGTGTTTTKPIVTAIPTASPTDVGY